MTKDDFLTDEQVEAEIEKLRNSENVKLSRAEQRLKYKRRQALYALRWHDKRGRELAEQGLTMEMVRKMSAEMSVEADEAISDQ